MSSTIIMQFSVVCGAHTVTLGGPNDYRRESISIEVHSRPDISERIGFDLSLRTRERIADAPSVPIASGLPDSEEELR